MTATATDATGKPVTGTPIVFSVTGANPTAAPVTVMTDANGQAKFCYTGKKVGLDVITAFADADKDTQQDATEPLATATKTYLPRRRTYPAPRRRSRSSRPPPRTPSAHSTA